MVATRKSLQSMTWAGKLYYIIPLADLNIDPTYQRELNKRLVRVRAADGVFDSNALRPLTVSLRKNGQYFILDGMNRKEIASARPDGEFTDYMCEVITGLSPVDEAKLFVKLNEVKTVNAKCKFRAAVAAGDPDALEIIRIVQANGFGLWKVGNQAFNVNMLPCKAVQRIAAGIPGRIVLNEALSLIHDAFSINNVVCRHACKDLFVSGLAQFLHDNGDLDRSDIRECLKGMDPEEFSKQVQKASGLARKDAVPFFAIELKKRFDNWGKSRKRKAAQPAKKITC